jgi:Regulator of chromosome condensation (RCC1) repeat
MEWLRGVGCLALLAVALPACSADDDHERRALSGVTGISAGFDNDCALIEDGSVRCWGSNFHGELGETSTGSWSAVAVPRVADAVGVSVGWTHACAAFGNGSVKCWGQLPGPSRSPSPAMQADGVTDAQAVAAGNMNSCAPARGCTGGGCSSSPVPLVVRVAP